jgi:CheY-like chemotaxis protein
MPLMDGYEATRQIRNYEAQQSCDRPVIIIAVSATGMTDHRRVAIPAGCNEFIQKPIAEAELFHVLQQTLNLRYRYEDNGDPAIDTRFWQGLRDQLETLSDSELEQLEEALIVGNESVILLMADAVAGGNVNLYQSLKTVTERLDYLPLLEMITAIRMERSIL